MMSDLATTVVWSGIQVSIFALIVAGTVLVIRKWLGGLVREILTVSLAVIILVPLLSMVPMPDWFSGSAMQPVAAVETVPAKQNDLESANPVVDDSNDFVPLDRQPVEPMIEHAGQSNLNSAPAWSTKLAELWEQLQNEPIEIEPEVSMAMPISIPSVASGPPQMTWLNLLFFAILFCVAIGLVRLAIGIRAVARLRKRSSQIDNEFAASEVERLCAQMGIRRRVELLQSEELSTPATVGWLNPVILLPASYESWSESELSSSIAHELAHVASADFAKNLVGQIAVVLNFYNPVVHYLGRELRVAQELAADALAASATGGRRNYLATMAQMALEQDTRQMGWLAQPFLPTRKTLLRRIEMLKGKRRLWGIRNIPALWLARLAILAVALACVCFRLPVVESAAARVQDPATATKPAPEPILKQSASSKEFGFQQGQPPSESAEVYSDSLSQDDVPDGVRAAIIGKSSSIATHKLAYVANKTRFFVAIDFDELSQKIDELPKLLKELSETTFGGGRMFVDLNKLQSASLQVYENSCGLVLNSRELVSDGLPDIGKKFTYRGQVCIEDEGGVCFHVVPSSATMLMAWRRDDLTTMLDSKNGPTVNSWNNIDRETLKRPIVAAASELGFEYIRRSTSNLRGELNMFSSLWTDSRYALAGLNLVDGQLRLSAFAVGNDQLAAKSVAETVTAAKVVFTNSVLKRDKPVLAFGDASQDIHELIRGAVKNISVSHESKMAQMNTQVRASGKNVSKLLAAITKDLGPLRYQTDNLNNLRQIALAMHNYESAYQRFPPASGNTSRGIPFQVNHPPINGKHPHSWRIAILPFIEQNEIYNRYKFDEPWDSPHNSKVTAVMPDVFRHPSQPRDSRNSCYYLVVGDKTMFPPDGRKISFEQISDGTSNTIMIVEAKRDVHWAKPDDIIYVPETLADQLGGFTPGEFVVAIGDGSVRTLKKESVFRKGSQLSHLVEIADGNITQVDDLQRVQPLADSVNKRLAQPTSSRFTQPRDGIRVSPPATPFKQAVPKIAVPVESPSRNKDK